MDRQLSMSLCPCSLRHYFICSSQQQAHWEARCTLWWAYIYTFWVSVPIRHFCLRSRLQSIHPIDPQFWRPGRLQRPLENRTVLNSSPNSCATASAREREDNNLIRLEDILQSVENEHRKLCAPLTRRFVATQCLIKEDGATVCLPMRVSRAWSEKVWSHSKLLALINRSS